MERHLAVRLIILASTVMLIWIARAEILNKSASEGPFWSTTTSLTAVFLLSMECYSGQ